MLALFASLAVQPAIPNPPALTLVIARSGIQDDPRPAPCGPDGSCGDSLFRSTFTEAEAVAGAPLPSMFDARLKLHSSLIGSYRLAMIVERQEDGSLIVRRRAGFNGRTGIACFDASDEQPLDWWPDASGVLRQGQSLCVYRASEIDPNAPLR